MIQDLILQAHSRSSLGMGQEAIPERSYKTVQDYNVSLCYFHISP
jgi:hypothetical protein